MVWVIVPCSMELQCYVCVNANRKVIIEYAQRLKKMINIDYLVNSLFMLNAKGSHTYFSVKSA